jgi:hypothetical protein
LNKAVERVHKDRNLTTIVVSKGTHVVEANEISVGGTNLLPIMSSVNIIGDPGVSKNEIIILGGFIIGTEIQGNVHLQNMTVRHLSKDGSGVAGFSSFTMKDIIVEQCDGYGVNAYENGVGRLTNVEVRQCGLSGMVAFNGASITLVGAMTTVHAAPPTQPPTKSSNMVCSPFQVPFEMRLFLNASRQLPYDPNVMDLMMPYDDMGAAMPR